MAAIDKIYLNSYEQYLQFREWCEAQPRLTDKYGKSEPITVYLFKYDEPFEGCHPVFKAPYFVDAYLIKNCPFEFIQKELRLNYGEHDQDWIDEAYKTVMERGGERCADGFYHWLSKDDFVIVDGVVTMPYEEKSTYQLIKEGVFYNTPVTGIEYEVGKHVKCIKHPPHKYNTPFGCKKWSVDVEPPIGYLWYHPGTNTWDFSDDYVIDSEWSCSHAWVGSIKALMRKLREWELPVGSIVNVRGRYIMDDYTFVIKK